MLLDLMLLFDPFILNKLDNGEAFNVVPFMTTLSKWLDKRQLTDKCNDWVTCLKVKPLNNLPYL